MEATCGLSNLVNEILLILQARLKTNKRRRTELVKPPKEEVIQLKGEYEQAVVDGAEKQPSGRGQTNGQQLKKILEGNEG